MRENGNGGAGWGEKEEMQLWIEKGLNKLREWQRRDGLGLLLAWLSAGLRVTVSPVCPSPAQQDKGELLFQGLIRSQLLPSKLENVMKLD